MREPGQSVGAKAVGGPNLEKRREGGFEQAAQPLFGEIPFNSHACGERFGSVFAQRRH